MSSNLDSQIRTIEVLPPAWDRLYRRSDEAHRFRLTVQNFLLPGQLLNVQNGAKLECELRITLFDVTYKQFFGKTLVVPRVDLKASSPSKDILVTLDKSVYFHTSFADQNIILAVEFSIFDALNTPGQSICSGWTFMRIFQPDFEIQDVSDSTTSQPSRLDLYHGSPRALLFLEEPLESNKHLQKILGSKFVYQLMTHEAMFKVLHIIPENVLISGQESIPGLVKDPKSHDVLKKIKIDRGTVLNLDKVVLLFDNVEKFEDELCYHMNEDRLNREHSSPDGSELTVVERRLQIGVHNGWSYVQEPQIHHLVPDSIVSTNGLRPALKPDHHRSSSIISKISSSSTSLVLRNKISLTEVPNKCFVIFLLEYVLSFPMPTIDRRPSSSASVGRGTTLAVAAAWGSWSVPKSNFISEHCISLQGGPVYNVDSLLLYRSFNDQESHSMKISFHCDFADKVPTASESQIHDGYSTRLAHDSDDDAASLRDEVSIRSRRPSSAATKPRRKSSTPKSPQKYSHISSPSKRPSVIKNEEPMSEVAYSSSPHLPIIPVLNEAKSSSTMQTMSRAGYAHLYSTGFPTILDRHGKAPDVVDYFDCVQISLEKEHADPLKCNEIIIEFLAFSGSDKLVHGQLVYFTFQFYRFPPVKSVNLLLQKSSNDSSTDGSYPLVLYKTDKNGLKKEPPEPGFQMKYDVNTSFLFDDDELKAFLTYMKTNTLFIDIWDSQSLFHIGQTSVILNHLCRQGRSAIQVISELDVVENESNICAEANGAAMASYILHLRMANIGRPLDPLVLKDKLSKSNSSQQSGQVQLLQPLVEEDRQLLELLKCYSFSNTDQMSDERKRKLARMNAIRARKGIVHVIQTNQLDFCQNKLKMLNIIDEYRKKHKDEIIRSVLCKSISHNYTLYPKLGNIEVILHTFVNNSDKSETIVIESQTPLIRVLANYSEWLHLKDALGFVLNLEEDMFSTDEGKFKLFLHPREKIIIPFAYQQTKLSEEMVCQLNEPTKAMMTNSDTYKVMMKSSSSGNMVSIINFAVKSQPISFDQSLLFHHPCNSFFKTSLQVPSHLRGQLSATCSDGDLICSVENSNNSSQSVIHLKVASGSSDVTRTFFIFLYNDRFSSQVIYCWRISVNFIQKIDICCTQGQTCRTSLILKGHHTTRSVKVHSSDPKLMAVEPAQAFVLPAGAMQEIHLGIRVMLAGSRYLQVNAVNEENYKLYKSWLVHVRAEQQAVSKAFQVNLPVGGAKAAKKKVKFTNPYPVKKTFTVQTNRADLLHVKENKFDLDGGESYSLSLFFMPTQKKIAVDVLVFINNSKDENEETFCIRTVFS